MTTPILNTEVRVDTTDIDEITTKFGKAGVAAGKFGGSAKKATGKTKGFGASVASLSDSLDKKLENTLGKTFRATDRFTAILGAAGGAATLLVGGIGILAAAFSLAKDDIKLATEELAKFKKGIITKEEAEKIAAGVSTSTKSLKEFSTAQLVAQAETKAELEKSNKLFGEQAVKLITINARVKELRAQLKEDEEASKVRGSNASRRTALALGALNNEMGLLKGRARLLASADRTRVASAALADKLAKQEISNSRQLAKLKKAFLKVVKKETDFVKKVRAEAKARADAEATAAKASAKIAAEKRRQAALAAKEQREFVAQHTADINSLAALEAISAPIRQKTKMDAAKARLLALADEEAAVARLTAKNKELADSQAKTSRAQVEGAKTSAALAEVLWSSAKAGIAAAASAALRGESVKEALNGVLEALTMEAGMMAMMELARGAAASAFGPLGHFEAAGLFGAVAAAAAVGTVATGGFGGGDSEAAAPERGVASPVANTGPQQAAGPVSSTFNVNLTAGSRPFTRMEGRQFIGELNTMARESQTPFASR